METRFFTVARIVAPWGIRGDVVLQVLSDNPQRFRPGSKVLLDHQERTVERQRTVSGKTVVKLSGVDGRNHAEELRGRLLQVPESDLMHLPADVYFQHQILGLEVRTSDGRSLGKVADIMKTGSNDVYVVRGEREYLIPAIGEVVKEVDLEQGCLWIEPVSGLLD